MPIGLSVTKALVNVVTSMAILSGGTFLAMERPEWLPYFGESDRVLVFLVGSRDGVDRVRSVVDPSRIVADSPDGIALVEGRIVAVDAQAVAVPYQQAGWMDREIEILRVDKADHLSAARERRGAGQRGEGRGECDEERMAKLRALVSKPTLSAGEQMFVLQAMNDGIEF